MMPKITRTMGPFHFEDLDPKRFEDLTRALANDFRDWQSIEATGRGGADDGIDIRAFERLQITAVALNPGDEDEDEPAAAHPMQGNLWIFQCKREKEIGPRRLKAILAEVDEHDPPYGYILAAPVNFSKTSYDTFRADLIKKGVMEFYLWGRAELEGMLLLPKNDRILFTFFGVSLVSKRRSRSTEIRGKVVSKNKLLRIMGDGAGHWPVLLRDTNDEHYPYQDQYPDFEKNPRWKQFEARRIHAHGLLVRHLHWYAYMDVDKMEFDFTDQISLVRPQSGIDDPDWEERHKDRELGDAIEDFWEHLPNRNRAEYCKNSLVRFEDMLVIDEKGISPDKCPHIFVDFQGGRGPFSGSYEFFEVRRGYSDPDKIPAKDFRRVKVFPDRFSAPTIGTVHSEGIVQLDADTHRLLVNGNEGIREYCAIDDRYKLLRPRDVFVLKGARDNTLKYFQITHTESTTVGRYIRGYDKEFRKEQLERQLEKELAETDVLHVFEFKPTYDWRVERLKGRPMDNPGRSK